MLEIIQADLHVHTCLSPCANLDMTPRKIALEARRRGLKILAVTDHNSAENAVAVQAAARDAGAGLAVLAGMEITSAEEAHVVALFPTAAHAQRMQEEVFEHLLPGENNEDFFGMQVVANELDEVEGFNKRLLIGATTISVDRVVERIHELDGLAIAAHIDRESYSVVGQLGFIPPDLRFDALEVSGALGLEAGRERFAEYAALPFVTASDAHDLADLGASPVSLRVEIDGQGKLAQGAWQELKLALTGREGRGIV